MLVQSTPLAGVYHIKTEPLSDERGYFARTFCTRELTAAGINFNTSQCSVSFNPQPLTLRGMHYQKASALENKIVRCSRGRIFDVAVDEREGSPTLHQCYGAELSADNLEALFIPSGCAHGFLTLMPDTEIFYMMDTFYKPDALLGVRWNDPAFAIPWPAQPKVIAPRDAAWPLVKI